MKTLMNFKIYDRPIEDMDLNEVSLINTINPHSYCMTKKDSDFENVLKNSDVLLPDGIGIVWASKLINKYKIEKIAGYDIFMFIMKNLNDTGGSCFFLGASQSTLDLILAKTKKEYPNVTVNAYSPPYKSEFSKEDNDTMLAKVNEHEPNVLFVGMTAPKQEKWGYLHKDELKANTICSIGAVFDFYAGTVKRSSSFWIKMGLEWLPRFIQEPKRLAERNLISTPKFILEVLSFKLRGKGILR